MLRWLCVYYIVSNCPPHQPVELLSHLDAQRLCHQQFPVPEDECALKFITQFSVPLSFISESKFGKLTHTHRHWRHRHPHCHHISGVTHINKQSEDTGTLFSVLLRVILCVNLWSIYLKVFQHHGDKQWRQVRWFLHKKYPLRYYLLYIMSERHVTCT